MPLPAAVTSILFLLVAAVASAERITVHDLGEDLGEAQAQIPAGYCCFAYEGCFDLDPDGSYLMHRSIFFACKRTVGMWIKKADKSNDDACAKKLSWAESYGQSPVHIGAHFNDDQCKGNDEIGEWFGFKDLSWETDHKGKRSGPYIMVGNPKRFGEDRPETYPEEDERTKYEEKQQQRRAAKAKNQALVRAAEFTFTCLPNNKKCNPVPEKDVKWLSTGSKYVPDIMVGSGTFLLFYDFKIWFTCSEPMLVCFIDDCDDWYSSKHQCQSGGSEVRNIVYNEKNGPAIKQVYVYLGDPWALIGKGITCDILHGGKKKC